MLSFTKILAPVDLSAASPKIAAYTLALAAIFDAEIHLLFVSPYLRYFIELYIPRSSIAKFENSLLKTAEIRLNKFENFHFKGWSKTRIKVTLGDIPDQIIRYARANDMELLVMGTNGRKGIGRDVFGSITSKVVNAVSVPVLVINSYCQKDRRIFSRQQSNLSVSCAAETIQTAYACKLIEKQLDADTKGTASQR